MSKYFNPKEWLPKDTYNGLLEQHKEKYADRYIDDRVLVTADKLREMFGPALSNTWSLPKKITDIYGIHNYRGWRSFDCTIGAKFSAHKFGQAMDLVFTNVSAKLVRDYIIEKPEEFPHIIELEEDISWLHYRTGIRAGSEIKIIHP